MDDMGTTRTRWRDSYRRGDEVRVMVDVHVDGITHVNGGW